MKKIAWGIAITLLCGTLTAFAEDSAAPAREEGSQSQLKQADKDGDRKLSPEEFQNAFPKASKARFESLDTNKDGFIDRSERPAREGTGNQGGILRRGDKNKDGKVTEAEFKEVFPGAPKERFKRLDRDGSGELTGADFSAAPKPSAREGKQQTAKQVEEKSQLAEARARLIETSDKDGDKKATLEEVQAAKQGFPEQAFKRLDANGDGLLDEKEEAKPGNAAKPAGEKAPQLRLREADKNGDGKVSFGEARAASPDITKAVFQRMDRNGDGVLTPADRKRAEPREMKTPKEPKSKPEQKKQEAANPEQV